MRFILKTLLVLLLASGPLNFAFAQQQPTPDSDTDKDGTVLLLKDYEVVEPYFSADGKYIIFQGAKLTEPGKHKNLEVYIWAFQPDLTQPSTEPVRITHTTTDPDSKLPQHECTYFSPFSNKQIFYAETNVEADLEFGLGFMHLYSSGYKIHMATLNDDFSIKETKLITTENAYNAEGVLSPVLKDVKMAKNFGNAKKWANGTYLLFTSSKDGNLELYLKRIYDDKNELITSNQETIRLTNTPTLQEGGAGFINDHQIIYRVWPYDSKEESEGGGMINPPMQLHILDISTGKDIAITDGDDRHWAPFPLRDKNGEADIFVYSKKSFIEKTKKFSPYYVWVMNLDKNKEEQITHETGMMDGFATLSPDGKYILFSRLAGHKMGEFTFKLRCKSYEAK